jgi:hypothetical protein
MTCRDVRDKLYDSWGDDEPLPFFTRLEIALHFLYCGHCAREARQMESAREILRNDFFPPAPHFEDPLMERIYAGEILDISKEEVLETQNVPGEISFRRWVITGLIVLVSLATAVFGKDFISIAASQGMSFLLPLGLTIGLVVSGYGALFIASHLRELSDLFGLR